jgi:hypothetical protein
MNFGDFLLMVLGCVLIKKRYPEFDYVLDVYSLILKKLHFFLSKKLEPFLFYCTVIDNEKVQKYSDHNPVIIALKI